MKNDIEMRDSCEQGLINKVNEGLVMLKYLSMIGKKVHKTSSYPFKSGEKTNTVKNVVPHPILNILAFTFEEDDSIIECHNCKEVR